MWTFRRVKRNDDSGNVYFTHTALTAFHVDFYFDFKLFQILFRYVDTQFDAFLIIEEPVKGSSLRGWIGRN